MKPAQGWVIVMLVGLVACSRSVKHCEVCAREECTGLAFRVTLTTGRTVETCCARCGLHYLRTGSHRAKGFQATDYATGAWIDAGEAVFVEGSDVNPCVTVSVQRDAYGCCAYQGFDRCSPSLIAFADVEQAKTFQAQHGGTFASLEKVKQE